MADKGIRINISSCTRQECPAPTYMSCPCFIFSSFRCKASYRVLTIFWEVWFNSKLEKQKLVATSSTHAEIRALYTPVLEIIFIVHMCITLHAIIFVIDLTKTLNDKVTRSKLILIEFIREQVLEGLIELRKIAAEANVADMLTILIISKTFTIKALHHSSSSSESSALSPIRHGMPSSSSLSSKSSLS
jgi:hypothetical protein